MGTLERTPIDYQGISYYSAPKSKDDAPKSLDEVDPELLRTYEKLGIPLEEQMMLAGIAVDAVFDSVSVVTTFKDKLAEAGVIFCSISSLKEYPELVRKHLGSVVPVRDNYFAALNCAVFSDGSFVYIPKGVRCPWSCPPTSASTRRTPGSLSAPLSSPTRTATSPTSRAARRPSAMKTSFTPPWWNSWPCPGGN